MVQEQPAFNMQSKNEAEFFQDHTLSFTNFQETKQRTLPRGTQPLYSNIVMSDFHKSKSVLSLMPYLQTVPEPFISDHAVIKFHKVSEPTHSFKLLSLKLDG